MLRVTKLLVAAGMATLMIPSASAQTSTYQELGQLIRAPRAITALGPDLFGDKVNLYTGDLEFVQTDVSLPGNNALPVSVGRRLRTGQYPTDGTLFGRWDLEIPHLHGIFAKSTGWPAARCSAFGAPPTVRGSFVSSWSGTEYWHGSFLLCAGRRRAGDAKPQYHIHAYTDWHTDL